MDFTRKDFLKVFGTGILSLSVPWPLKFALSIDNVKSGNNILIVIIQRGAMDGLSLLPPVDDPKYYELRPSIAIPKNGTRSALPLSNGFYLHSGAQALLPLWNDGNLRFVLGVASPDATRSHFDAQDYLESGEPGIKNVDDGFLNRALQNRFGVGSNGSALTAVALQPTLPRILQGKAPVLSFNSIRDLQLRPSSTAQAGFDLDFKSMYQSAANEALRKPGHEAFISLEKYDLNSHSNSEKDLKAMQETFPKSGIAKRLSEMAWMITTGAPVEVLVTDMGGWDTHAYQGNEKGQLSERFKELSEGIAAFRVALGTHWRRVTVVTMTEFGRTVAENGSHGTDHGHGSVMMVASGAMKRSRVHGVWPSLNKENLLDGRDLPLQFDHRSVMTEVLREVWQIDSFNNVFPKFDWNLAKKPGLYSG